MAAVAGVMVHLLLAQVEQAAPVSSLSSIKRENWPLREFRREKARLEDVFVELTQE